jgi:divalent metal cation (Fe/Co/Zn/Cd) transporter
MVGKRLDVSGHALLNNGLKFEDIHRILSEIETNVNRSVHRITRISVCTEPVGHEDERFMKLVKQIVDGVPGSRGVHGIRVREVAGKLCVDLDVEVGANMTLNQADAIANEVKKRLRTTCQYISAITIHMESASDIISRELQGRGNEREWSIEHEKGITSALENG